ncbi:MAG: pyruvate formate lyase family protein [bacterium]
MYNNDCFIDKFEQFSRLKDKIFSGDNSACFIEREAILRRMVQENSSYTETFVTILNEVSTPIEDDDFFLGRVVEGVLPDKELHNTKYYTNGHMTLDWPTLLSKGLAGIVKETHITADNLGTTQAREFAENSERFRKAITDYAQRYAVEAEKHAENSCDNDAKLRFSKAANTLLQIPNNPATDLFSALQSIWIIHMITSCYIGARDFAFGRMDQYLLLYYQHDIDNGVLTREDAKKLFSHFFIKTNEITGTSAFNYKAKPIPSVSSKQYLILGGRDINGKSAFNDLSQLILEAAIDIQLPEPVLSIRLDSNHDDEIFKMIAEATQILQSQIHFFNDDVIIPSLLKSGVAKDDAANYTMVGCCRADIGGFMDDGMMLSYQYHNVTSWMLTAFNSECHESLIANMTPTSEIKTFAELLNNFKISMRYFLTKSVNDAEAQLLNQEVTDTGFRFESMLLNDCVKRGLSYQAGGTRYRPQGHFFGGIATVANSLMAIKHLVFDEKKYDLNEYLDIVKRNFAGDEQLHEEVCAHIPKYGNDIDEVDNIAKEIGIIIHDILDSLKLSSNHIMMSAFYSLDSHHAWGRDLPTTPDGRIAGEPVSENQSPTYGTDLKGITAVLKSVAKLPHYRTTMGGLNIKFGGKISSGQLAALLKTYFILGGIHLGCTFITKNTLLSAQKNPKEYRNLCVRMYGFSEYFIALSKEEQQELIERTEL